MKKTLALCAAMSVLGAAAAFAGPTKNKVTDVWTCPITGEKVTAAKQVGTPVVVGKYRVHFCCGGCPDNFNKMTSKEKLQKAEIAAKKDTTAKKG